MRIATNRKVLWAAGVIALVGLVGGGAASSHLTSSLSDYDAPGSAVVLAQHQIQKATGVNPEEGYEVVVRTGGAVTEASPLPARVATVVALAPGASRSQKRARLCEHRRPGHDLQRRRLYGSCSDSWRRAGKACCHCPGARHCWATVAERQHLARGADGRRRPASGRLFSGPWTCRALRAAVPDAVALLRVPRPPGGGRPLSRCGVRHRGDPGRHGPRHVGRAAVGLRPKPGNCSGLGALCRLQPVGRIALS